MNSPAQHDKPFLLVCGMFRSGTTLLARMFNAHPDVSFATDPYLSFFKFFRSQIAAGLGIHSLPDSALDDYYFSKDGLRLLQAIRSQSLDLAFDENRLPALREAIRKYGTAFSPRIMDSLGTVRGSDYGGILGSMLDLLQQGYGKPGRTLLGFKMVWANEFIPAVAASFPNARFIQIIRDPRAVCASKNVVQGHYPWLFMARQWRKIAALSWLHAQDKALRDRVLTIRYEDLIATPETVAKAMCDFLRIEFSSQMTDATRYVDGAGEAWQQNTSYGKGQTGFDREAIDRWRKALSPQQIACIESLCAPEMLLHGYSVDPRPDSLHEQALFPVRVADELLAEWIKREYPNDPLTLSMQMADESLRGAILALAPDALRRVSTELLEGCFLDRSIVPPLASVYRSAIQRRA